MEKNTKTLVIHPYDRSTDFLEPIYSNLTDATILKGSYSKTFVRQLIEEHDRIIMLGHGSPNGLFNVGQFTGCNNGMIIDESMVAALGRKKNNLYIWCHANQFVERYNLNGFYSGMFISEYGEAAAYSVKCKEGDVEQSNDLFASIVGKNILKESKQLCEDAKSLYYIQDNLVNEYNKQRLNWR